MDLDTPITCVFCAGTFCVRGLLAAGFRYAPRLGVLSCKASCCGATEELAVETGRVFRGYVYAAGSAHFSREEEYQAPGVVAEQGPSELVLWVDGERRRVAAG